MSQAAQPGLVRAIGRWSLAALLVNSIIGSGVFKLPSDVAGLIGPASVWAVLVVGGKQLAQGHSPAHVLPMEASKAASLP